MNRVLVDTGPLVALLDRKDPDHGLCVGTSKGLPGPLVTSWAALTEASCLLAPDVSAQERLLGEVESGDLLIGELGPQDMADLRALLRKYADMRMDLADATLIRLAARDGFETVFTLDDHFRAYRAGRRALRVTP